MRLNCSITKHYDNENVPTQSVRMCPTCSVEPSGFLASRRRLSRSEGQKTLRQKKSSHPKFPPTVTAAQWLIKTSGRKMYTEGKNRVSSALSGQQDIQTSDGCSRLPSCRGMSESRVPKIWFNSCSVMIDSFSIGSR